MPLPKNPWCGGGGAIRTWKINTLLAQRGHEITLCCGNFPGAKISIGNEPFEVRFLGEATNYIESRLKFVAYSATVSAGNYDIVVEDFSAYAPVFPRLQGAPRITVLHSFYGLGALRMNGILGIFSLLSEFLILKRRENVILVSPHLKQAVPRAENIEIIGQGVDVPVDLPPPTEEFVLYLGRIDIEVKGLDLLLKGWSMIAPHHRKFPLFIVGGGHQNEIDRLKRMIHALGLKDVILKGRVSHEEGMRYINRASFVVMPSRSEGFGLVAAEVLRLRKPIIVSDIPSLKAIINNYGVIVRKADVKQLSESMKQLILNEQYRRHLSASIGMKDFKRFEWSYIVRQTENFYQRLL